MTVFAKGTQVSVDRSKREIELILERYGATQFAYGWNDSGAAIGFRMNGRFIRLNLPIPAKDSDEFRLSPNGRWRTDTATLNAWEQACRQRWRALVLVIKAKLEAVESGITSFEDEFLAYTLLPDGRTVADASRPALVEAYETGKTPPLLPAPR